MKRSWGAFFNLFLINSAVMNITTIKTSIFKVNQDLLAFLTANLPTLNDGDIVVVTSKIVALAEGRIVSKNSGVTKEEIIKQESSFVLPTKYVRLTVKDGAVMASAGIDESNAQDCFILLPADSFLVANQIRHYLLQQRQLQRLGVIITDSRSLPLRAGIAGVALGYAGFGGLRDYRGCPDIFGRPLHFSRVNLADSLAAAAVLCMGEADERQPLAVISEAPVIYCEQVDRHELWIDSNEDIYAPLFKNYPAASFDKNKPLN